jgi:hypothetical protein
MNFRIRAIPFSEISETITGGEWDHAKVIPITPERAGSQQKNPHALPGQSCLWVATSGDGQVIGFAGSLPGYDVHNSAPMGWNSCWWVDQVNGKEAAMPLFYNFLKQWDQRVAFADMTPRTRAIIDQLGFCHTREMVMVQRFFRIPSRKVISRLGIAGVLLSPLIFTMTGLVNAIQQVRLKTCGRRRSAIDIEVRDHLDDELYTFIQQHWEKDFARRSKEEFRWIEDNPWLVKRSPFTVGTGKKYPFSYVVREYRLEWLVTRREQGITSVMLVSFRDGALKVLYYFGNAAADACEALLASISGNRKVHAMLYTHPGLVARLKECGTFSMHTRYGTRIVGVSKKILASFPEELVIQLGDGDAVFT